MSNITILNGITSLPIPVIRVAEGLVADADTIDNVLILGFDKEGMLFSRSSHSDVGAMLEMMEMFKHNLMLGSYNRVE